MSCHDESSRGHRTSVCCAFVALLCCTRASLSALSTFPKYVLSAMGLSIRLATGLLFFAPGGACAPNPKLGITHGCKEGHWESDICYFHEPGTQAQDRQSAYYHPALDDGLCLQKDIPAGCMRRLVLSSGLLHLFQLHSDWLHGSQRPGQSCAWCALAQKPLMAALHSEGW